jgi:hypothetical protein
MNDQEVRDMRAYARNTQARLIVGALLLVLAVGASLIWLVYGGWAAGMGLACILLGLGPVVLIYAALRLAGWIVARERLR